MTVLHLGEVGVEGRPASWDLSAPPAHGLVVGETGSGKTWLTRDLVKQATSSCDVWLADGKGGEDFVACSVTELALGAQECMELLDEAADEVTRRLAAARQPCGPPEIRPLLLVVDELAALQLRRRSEDARAHRDRRERFQAALGEIALIARAADTHLLVALQRPDTDVIPGAVRDQLGLRIALGWMSADGARMLGWGALSFRTDLAPGNGWISSYTGHQGPPEPFCAVRQCSTRTTRRSKRLRLPWSRSANSIPRG